MKISVDSMKRGFMLTDEFSKLVGRNPQTVRKELCLKKSAFGITPLKINGRLMWPVDQTLKLFPNSMPNCNSSKVNLESELIELSERLACANRQLKILNDIFDEYGITKLASGYELHLPERLLLLLAKQELK